MNKKIGESDKSGQRKEKKAARRPEPSPESHERKSPTPKDESQGQKRLAGDFVTEKRDGRIGGGRSVRRGEKGMAEKTAGKGQTGETLRQLRRSPRGWKRFRKGLVFSLGLDPEEGIGQAGQQEHPPNHCPSSHKRPHYRTRINVPRACAEEGA